jgi:hypothetical protein
MNTLYRKILVSIFFSINVILGKIAFEYFLGLAWFPENNGGFLVVYIKNSSDWMLWRIYICISARAILAASSLDMVGRFPY